MRTTHTREICAPVNAANRRDWINPNRLRCPKVGGESFGHLAHLEMRKTVWGSFAHLRSNKRKTMHGPRCAHWPRAIPGACPHERCARRISPHREGFCPTPGAKLIQFRPTAAPQPPTGKQLATTRWGETRRVSPHEKKEKNFVGRNSAAPPLPQQRVLRN